MTRLLLVLVSSFPAVASLAQTPATSTVDEVRGRAVGEIRNRKGEPWAGAEVVLLSRPIPNDPNIGEPDQVIAITDAQGRFQAQILRGRPYTAWAWGAPGAEGRPATPVTENVFVQRPVVVREDRLLPARRVVLDGTGNWSGCTGFEVRVVDQTGNRRVLWIDAKEGAVELPFLVGTHAFVEVFARQAEVRCPLTRVSIAARDQASVLRVALPERQRVTCWVREEGTGTPCAGATVFRRLAGALYPAGNTDAEGKLALDLAKVTASASVISTLVLAEGRMFGVLSRVGDAGADKLDVPEGAVQGDLFANLTPGETLHARVVGLEARPVTGLTVWCTGLAHNQLSANTSAEDNWVRSVTTDAQGVFKVGGLAGDYFRRLPQLVLHERNLAALPPRWRAGLAPIVFGPLVGQPGTGTAEDPYRVDLCSLCPIELRITGEGSTPVSDATLTFSSLDHRTPSSWPWQCEATADQMGRLRVLVPAGQHLGFSAARGLSFLVRGFETGPGRPADGPAVASFELGPPTGIRGRVLERDGSPGRDRTVHADFNGKVPAWGYESEAASRLADPEHNCVRVLLPDDDSERLMLWMLMSRPVATDDKGCFTLPLPPEPLPGMRLFTGRLGVRAISDWSRFNWNGETSDDFELRAKL